MGKLKNYATTYTDPSGKVVKKKTFKAENMKEAKQQAQTFKSSIGYNGPGRLKTGIIIIDT